MDENRQPQETSPAPTPNISPVLSVEAEPLLVDPVAAANQPPFVTPPLSGEQFVQQSHSTSSKWRVVFVTTSIVQALGVSYFLLSPPITLGQIASEHTRFALYVSLSPVVSIVALINLIGLPIYMVKRKPRGKELVFYIVSWVIAAYWTYETYSMYVGLQT